MMDIDCFFYITYLFITLMASKAEENIVEKDNSYKDRTFCSTRLFNQSIALPGCKSKIVVNNFCYGQCNSKFLQDQNIRVFHCSFCKPVDVHIKTVDLVCEGDKPKTVQYEYIKLCACKEIECKRTNVMNPEFRDLKSHKTEQTRVVKTRSELRRRKKRCRRKSGKKKRKCLKRWKKDRKRKSQVFQEQFALVLQNLDRQRDQQISQ